MRRIVLALGILALGFVAATPASAVTTVSRAGDTVTIVGGDERNTVLLLADRGGAVVADREAIAAGPGCESTSVRLASLTLDDRGLPRSGSEDTPAVACGAPAVRVEAALGGGDDTFVSLDNGETAPGTPTPPLRVDGGPGNDVLRGSRSGDTLLGGPGSDELRGEGGDDVLDGGPGRDDLQGDSVLTGELDDFGVPTAPAFGGDRLLARDGEGDLLRCGPGTDSVIADALDSSAAMEECERRDGLGKMAVRIGAVRQVRLGDAPLGRRAALLAHLLARLHDRGVPVRPEGRGPAPGAEHAPGGHADRLPACSPAAALGRCRWR